MLQRVHRVQQPRTWLIQEAEQLQEQLLKTGQGASGEGPPAPGKALADGRPVGDGNEEDSAQQMAIWQRERRKLLAGDDDEAAACIERIRVRALEAVVSSQGPASLAKSKRKLGGLEGSGSRQRGDQGDEGFEGVFPELHVRTSKPVPSGFDSQLRLPTSPVPVCLSHLFPTRLSPACYTI